MPGEGDYARVTVMRSVVLSVVMLALAVSTAAAAGPRELLSRARQLYNAGKYDEAIEAARGATAAPELVDRARIVVARASLERFRRSMDPADLSTARETLAQIKNAELGLDDRLDLIIATGELLYFDDKPGAAAEQFDVALGRVDPKRPEARELILDWWASALDRQAQVVSAAEARAIEMRIVSRMEEELQRAEESRVASYWLVAATRAAGDVERAWSAAIAAWVRAAQAGPKGAALQADLNRLVIQVVIPERARQLAANSPEGAAASAAAMRKEWESLKQAWLAR
jgi:hypothetical protein